MALENIVQNSGGFGSFQLLLLLATQSCRVVAAWAVLMMVFGNYNPGWDCVLRNTSAFRYRSNYTHSPNFEHFNISQQKVTHNTSDSLAQFEGSCDVIDSCEYIEFDPSAVTVVTQWTLLCDKSWVTSVILSLQMAGMLVGSSLAGQFSESYGRRVALYANTGLFSLANALAAFSVSWEMFATLRFFIGLFIGGILSQDFVCAIEFMGPKARSIFASVPVWSIAGTLYFLIVVALKNWWHLHVVTAIASGLSFLNVIWVPENVQWLVLQGRIEEAKTVVQKVARMNKKPVPDTTELDNAMEAERTIRESRTRSKYTYLDIFTRKELRKTTACIGISGTSIFISYYCLSFGVKALYGEFFINLVLSSLVDAPASLFIALTLRFFGRRVGCALYIGIACAFSVVSAIIFFVGDESTKGPVITSCSFCAKTVLSASVTLVHLFVSESVPTVVRSLSSGWYILTSCFAGIIAPAVIPDEPGDLWISFVVMACLLLTTVGLLLTLSDTTDRPLQDSIGVTTTREGLEGARLRNQEEEKNNESTVA